MDQVQILYAFAVAVSFICLWSRTHSVPIPAAIALEDAYLTETDGNRVPLNHQTWQSPKANGVFGERKYFTLNLLEKKLLLNLTKNMHFFPGSKLPIFSIRHSNDGAPRVRLVNSSTVDTDCRYAGSVHESSEEAPVVGWATVSLCNGMHGLIKLETATFSIKPDDQDSRTGVVWRHKVERQASLSDHSGTECATTGTLDQNVEKIVSHVKGLHKRREVGVSSQKFIETALVADKQTLDYHGSYDNLVAYVLDIMNVVSHIFQDPSTGCAIQVVLVKLIVIESDISPFHTSNVGNTLKDSFCKWQSTDLAVKSPEHDIAVLLTRNKICEPSGSSCNILGTANLGSICNLEKSCVVVKDIGLGAAFTMAHEFGHSLGLLHDEDVNAKCSSGYYLMSSSMLYSDDPHTWSECSKKGLQDYLESHESSCLDSVPQTTIAPSASSVLTTGEKYTLDKQCALLYGPSAVFCTEKADEVCAVLHCQLAGEASCRSNSFPPAPGSPCTLQNGSDGLCYQGRCEHYSIVSQPVDGAWGQWGEWSRCNKKCGTGVQSRERECDSPVPAYGGRTCLGRRQEHRLCNTHECEQEENLCTITVKQIQYRPNNDSYIWTPLPAEEVASFKMDPCQLSCTNQYDSFIHLMKSTVEDGTHCLTREKHWDGVCISNECIQIGCDGQLGTNTYVDVCGVKCGNGSTCYHTSGIFVPSVSAGAQEIVLTIPSGSWDIVIEEISPSNNTLVVISDNFNGDTYPDMDTYQYAKLGGVWWYYYKNSGENTMLKTGNTVIEDIILQIVVKDPSRKLQYSLTSPVIEDTHTTVIPDTDFDHEETDELVKNETSVVIVNYFWKSYNWSLCSALCGNGQETREVSCVSEESKRAADDLCDPTEKPATSRTCFIDSCTNFHWVTSGWSECNTYCGSGEQSRSVMCSRVNGTEVDDAYCATTHSKPAPERACESSECPRWVQLWSECSASCGGGKQETSTHCLSSDDDQSLNCDPNTKPVDVEQDCNTQTCCSDTFAAQYCNSLKDLGYCSHSYYGPHCCHTCNH